VKTRIAKAKVKVEESSGNVFEDLGLPNPDETLVKAKLAIHIGKIVESKGWNQGNAAKRMGIDQPKVSKILRGQLSEFSIERLLGFLRAIGCDVEIVLKNGSGSPAALRVVEERLA
jgi:predicted XRE-type DNA-binding protein